MKVKVKGINLSWIVVSDFEKAKKFYLETLGLEAININDEYGWMELMGKEGSYIGVAKKQSEDAPVGPGNNAVITMTVDNLDEAMKEFSAKGVVFFGEVAEVPGHVKLRFFKDTDGNIFQLVQELS